MQMHYNVINDGMYVRIDNDLLLCDGSPPLCRYRDAHIAIQHHHLHVAIK